MCALLSDLYVVESLVNMLGFTECKLQRNVSFAAVISVTVFSVFRGGVIIVRFSNLL